MKAKKKRGYSFGEVFKNQYLGNTITEVLAATGARIGWIWTHSDGKVIVSPQLGFYVWFGPQGEAWTMESGARWLADKR